ncbi:MAG: hypothetical protein ACLP0J_07105 [Solirubrobacteraceae bacterium]
MVRAWRVFVGLAALLGAAVLSSSALALDSADSITLTGTSSATGHIYAGYPFAFNGNGAVDGNSFDYQIEVLFVPTSEAASLSSCPADYAQTAQAIEIANGGTLSLSYHQALGVGDPLLGGESGPYTWDAPVNADLLPTVTAPGTNVACAYLIDDLNNTLAVSPAPLVFTVVDPPGTDTPPGGFGGPPPNGGTPSDLTLTVAPQDPPIKAPGLNIINVSGRADSSAGYADVFVTLNDVTKYDGCAPDSQQDVQITQADGGSILAYAEQVTISQSGVFRAPIALNYKRAASGTGVICAYLDQSLSDVAVGYERFTLTSSKAKAKAKTRSKATAKARSKHHKKKKSG